MATKYELTHYKQCLSVGLPCAWLLEVVSSCGEKARYVWFPVKPPKNYLRKKVQKLIRSMDKL